jgi:hypothetical protein
VPSGDARCRPRTSGAFSVAASLASDTFPGGSLQVSQTVTVQAAVATFYYRRANPATVSLGAFAPGLGNASSLNLFVN